MSRTRKPKMPKLRIPVAPPGFRHPSKKDYERVKKVELPDEHEDYYDRFDCCDAVECSCFRTSDEDLNFLLKQFGISSARTRRVASYGN